MEQQIKDLNDKVDKIYSALVGNDDLKIDGLVDKVDKNTKYIENDKKMKWTAAGIITAVSSFINYLLRD
jgi:t-SNARE complex subunit (syntaxin)